jgi:hypothetical protein
MKEIIFYYIVYNIDTFEIYGVFESFGNNLMESLRNQPNVLGWINVTFERSKHILAKINEVNGTDYGNYPKKEKVIDNTCSNCMYWGGGFKVQVNKHNECGQIGLDESDSMEMAFIDVEVADDSGLSGQFKTLGNFSCSLHKLKK